MLPERRAPARLVANSGLKPAETVLGAPTVYGGKARRHTADFSIRWWLRFLDDL